MNPAWTIGSLLHAAEDRLHGLESARLDAEVLLCHVAGLDRSSLYSRPEQSVEPQLADHFMQQIAQRQQGKPVAYLTGEREFWSMDFHVDRYTLVPRPETECLVEITLEHIPVNTELHVADLGTGSGAVAIAIARERPKCKIMATDICEHALATAKNNARRHGTDQIIFCRSDWYQDLDGTYDIIVSNPPYIREGDAHLQDDGIVHEPWQALCGGPDGLEAIRCIVNEAKNHLRPDGWLIIEHGYDQSAAVRILFEQHHFTHIDTRLDYAGQPRVTYGQYRD